MIPLILSKKEGFGWWAQPTSFSGRAPMWPLIKPGIRITPNHPFIFLTTIVNGCKWINSGIYGRPTSWSRKVSGALWKWTGLNHTTSTILGGVSGVAYQSIIEIQDGFSSEWGFSWGDMTANVIGASAYVAQELGWKDQRIQVKLSYWPYEFIPPELIDRRNQLFGTNPIEEDC